MGVWPLWIVASLGSTLSRLPFLEIWPQNVRPGAMSSSEPLLAIAPAQTLANADAACVGSPLMATWPLYTGLARSASVVGQLATSLALQPMEMKPP